jgi:hypothetical protein
MKINEIDDIDRSWATMVELDLDIDNNARKAIGRLQILVSLQNPHLNKQWLPRIDPIEKDLLLIIKTKFADDDSTKKLQSNAYKYLIEIQNLKSQL